MAKGRCAICGQNDTTLFDGLCFCCVEAEYPISDMPISHLGRPAWWCENLELPVPLPQYIDDRAFFTWYRDSSGNVILNVVDLYLKGFSEQKYSKLQIVEAASVVTADFTSALPFAASEFVDTVNCFLIDLFTVLEGGM